jgi:hypothetical protein
MLGGYFHRSGSALPIIFCIAGLSACSFQPMDGKAEPRRVSSESVALVRTLDPIGKLALVQRPGESGRAVMKWHDDRSCALPSQYPNSLRSLQPPSPAPKGVSSFYLACTTDNEAGQDAELVMVDDQCRLLRDFPEVLPETIQVTGSVTDQHGILVARDREGRLYALDPYGSVRMALIAELVTQAQPVITDGKKARNAVWAVEGSRLTLRTLTGEPLVALGTQVTDFALSADQKRVAFIDAGDLYEALAPAFKPRKLADDACNATFLGQDLGAFSPCEKQQLITRLASDDAVHRYPDGVFLARRFEGLELTFQHTESEGVRMFARYGKSEPELLSPTLRPQTSYYLSDGSVLGVSEDGTLGTFAPDTHRFRPLLEGVTRMQAEYRGKSQRYWFLVHHDVTDGLGTLSVVDAPDMSVREVARNVPTQGHQGFLLESGRAIPNYPFAAPTVLMLSEASEDADGAFVGTLRAELITGDPAEDFGARVSSYLIVANPQPGVLYSVGDGDKQGLWFAAF